MPFNPDKALDCLYNFKLQDLFIQELGWANPIGRSVKSLEIDGRVYTQSQIARMSEVPIFEIAAPDGDIPPADVRNAIHKQISDRFTENLLIFVNQNRTRSLWYWVKREGGRSYPRTESYVQGQPPDLLLSKIGGLYIPLEELESGDLPVIDIALSFSRALMWRR